MKKVVALALGSAVVMGAQLANPVLASAHETSVGVYDPYTGTRLGYGGVTNSHTRLYSCDTRADGAGVRAYYRLKNGQSGYTDDLNGGPDNGCTGIYPGSSSNPIVSFRVAWKNGGGNATSIWIYSAWKTA